MSDKGTLKILSAQMQDVLVLLNKHVGNTSQVSVACCTICRENYETDNFINFE